MQWQEGKKRHKNKIVGTLIFKHIEATKGSHTFRKLSNCVVTEHQIQKKQIISRKKHRKTFS